MKKKKFLFFLVLPALLLGIFGCPSASDSGKMQVTCGLPPVAYLASRIGGELIEVKSMLPEGRSPHDYSPRPGDVADAGRSRLFFTTGMNFEKTVTDSRMLVGKDKVVDVSAGIKRRHFDDGHGCCDGHGAAHDHGEGSLDPHVWLSPANAVVIAENIFQALKKADPANQEQYSANFEKLKAELLALDAGIKKQLAPYAGKSFMVYHPAFGYFADAFALKQFPLEINGREMKPEQLAHAVRYARNHGVRVVFVQKQFNPRTARELASRIGGSAEPLDPLAWDLVANFKAMADAVSQGFGAKK